MSTKQIQFLSLPVFPQIFIKLLFSVIIMCVNSTYRLLLNTGPVPQTALSVLPELLHLIFGESLCSSTAIVTPMLQRKKL